MVLWEDIAPYLGLDEAEIVEIQKDNNGFKGFYRQQKVCCLQRWKLAYGDKASYQFLKKAAEASEQIRVCSYIDGLFNESKYVYTVTGASL